jgi:hypothetical protein
LRTGSRPLRTVMSWAVYPLEVLVADEVEGVFEGFISSLMCSRALLVDHVTNPSRARR